MASNTEREILALRDTIMVLESHLYSGTASGGGGWHTASEGERRDMRAKLDGARRKLRARLDALPPQGVKALEELLRNDRLVDLAWLRRQAASTTKP